ncbi:IS3 family transposase [Candidatus Peregrinibacteria bacterium]|nr:IS3 family transposase [Candidatus Peregrinibacteria bacterium]
MCRIYRAARSGYYAWRRRSESQRAKEEKALLKKIHRIFKRSKGTYGSPRILSVLRRVWRSRSNGDEWRTSFSG